MYYLNKERNAYRNLTLKEAKRGQTIPHNYDFSEVAEGKAFHMIGNGWTVDVIAHIFKGLYGTELDKLDI